MRINNELKLDFKDVLIEPKRSILSSRSDVQLVRAFKVPINYNIVEDRLVGVPIIAANMDTVGTMSMAIKLAEHGMFTALHKHYGLDELFGFFKHNEHWRKVFYTVGSSEKDEEKLSNLRLKLFKYWEENFTEDSIELIQHYKETFPYLLCIDVANGYTRDFCNTVKRYRDKYPNSIIMAGNVVTPNMTEELINCGAGIVKIGIGPGSACTTRIKTGVGYGQLSAIIECADAAHGVGGLICGDGGCKVPGDIVKAFGGGADFVMIGGMLAGTDECEGEWEYHNINTDFDPPLVEINGNKKKALKFYGMSSREAMEKHNGGVANHRTAEGKCVKISYKGKVEDILLDIEGGLRSACTYVGAMQLKDLSKCTTFNRTTVQENTIFNEYNA